MKKKDIFANLKLNKDYILYYSKIAFRSRINDTKLGILWLLLEPLAFMLIYSFVVQFIFSNNRMPNFNLFIFIGLTSWKFFSGAVLSGPSAIVKNKSIFEQVYFHKFVYPSINLLVSLYEFLIANSLIVILIIIARIPITWHMFEFIPVSLVLILFTYGLTLIAAHVGVYFFDLRNMMEIVLRFMFYVSPIMWSYDMFKHKLAFLLKLNPMSVIIGGFRDALFYGKSPDYVGLGIITLVSVLLIAWGYHMISKHEDEYGRVL